jgi:threonine dehydrogenase-like Zn-dependent dehydrogenase
VTADHLEPLEGLLIGFLADFLVGARGTEWRGAVLQSRSTTRWPAPVRRYLPELIELTLQGKIQPGKVFDLTLRLDQVAEGYRDGRAPHDQDAASPVTGAELE